MKVLVLQQSNYFQHVHVVIFVSKVSLKLHDLLGIAKINSLQEISVFPNTKIKSRKTQKIANLRRITHKPQPA